MTRRADDNPLVAVLMLVLLLGAAGGALWISVREKATGERQYSSVETFQSPLTPAPGTAAPGKIQFVESFKRLPNSATAMQTAADAEFDRAARFIGADELPQVQRLISRGGSRDDYSDSELALLRRHGLGSWIRAKAVQWSKDDPAFNTAAESVWARSSKAKSDSGLTELAVRWGEMDRAGRLQILQIIHAVETKTRELTASERDVVTRFAGDEYLANR